MKFMELIVTNIFFQEAFIRPTLKCNINEKIEITLPQMLGFRKRKKIKRRRKKVNAREEGAREIF